MLQTAIAPKRWGRLPLWAVERDRDLAEGRFVRVRASALGRDGETVVDAFLAHRNDTPPGPAAHAFGMALRRHAHTGHTEGV